MICVVIGRSRHKMVKIEVQEAVKRGAQLVEIRLDYLARSPDFKRLLAEKPCAMIATVRRPEDGGRWSGAEDARQALLRQAIVSGFDWVDLETDIADKIRRFKEVKRIISYHNLRETPPDLEAIYARMCQQDPDIVKVAVTAQQPADNLRVLALLKDAPKPTVAMCMGDIGMPSRILGAKLGAAFTYAVFNKDYRVAPGILSFDELRQVYNYDGINAGTAVFGVIGDPVAQSLSPLIHNAAFRQLKLNCVYLPFRVPRSQLPGFLKDYDRLGIRGYSVTIPHKEAAATLAHVKDDMVTLSHSANTLLRVKEGFAAYNTDAPAALGALLSLFPAVPEGGESPLQGRTVLLVGAGGVARPLAHALRQVGAQVFIANRTAERAQKLAAEAGASAVEWSTRNTAACDVLINCTPVGMHPNVDEMPMLPTALRPGLIVMDTVYNPETTLLVKEARQHRCQVCTGVEMFVRQAALQFKLFTGRDAPLDLMTRLVKQALSPVAIKDEPAAEEEPEGDE
ncbi:MAG: shikimate dehydrogenase [Planctomycetia bacterium]|nr:shikimate dehydrogenase [Planctomycetia bacterium]